MCAGNPAVCQLLKQPHCFQSIGPLIQLPSSEIKLFSKALIARLIPINAVNDDMAVLMVIEDEVDHLISLISSTQSIPIISVIMDLCRSPHNMCVFASRNEITSKLADMIDSIGEDEQSKVAQLIWRMMEFNYEGNEEMCAIINNGTLHGIFYLLVVKRIII